MRKFKYIAIILLLVSCSTTKPKTFNSFNEYYNFFEYYYIKPQPDKVVPSISYYVNSEYFAKQNTRMPSSYFYASVLSNNPDLVNILFESLKTGSKDERMFALHIFWVMDSQSRELLLERSKAQWNDQKLSVIATKMSLNPPKDILNTPVRNPGTLDNLWGVFYGTGSEKAIQQIISVIHLREVGQGGEIILGGAAKWSLGSNAQNHKKILEVIKSVIPTSHDEARPALEEILNKNS